MSEIKRKAPNAKSWAEGQDLIKNLASFKDFDANGIEIFKPTKGEKFDIKNPQVIPNGTDKNGNDKGYPVVECYKDNEFMGYLTFRRLYGYKFIEVRKSETKGTFYAKNEAQNDFVKDGSVLLGSESLGEKLAKKQKYSVTCKNLEEQMIPAFGEDLSQREFKTVEDTIHYLDIK